MPRLVIDIQKIDHITVGEPVDQIADGTAEHQRQRYRQQGLVIFKPGQKYDFTLAAFDHNANRHSYNHQVYSLYLEE